MSNGNPGTKEAAHRPCGRGPALTMWYWCPCCQRAFPAEAPASQDNGSAGQEEGVEPTCPVNCPYEDCGADRRCIMTWETARRWAAQSPAPPLPLVPVQGRVYHVPGAGFRRDPGH